MQYNDLFIDNDLPKPLSKQEIYGYFEKYNSGDRMAREIIIKHNIRFVISQVIRKFGNTPYDKNELVSVGIIGLIKSVDTFDISKNFQFSTYAVRCIDNEILVYMRKGKKYIYDDSFDRILATDDGKELKIENILQDEKSNFVEDYEKKELLLMLRQLVEELPERDKEIIMLRFGFIGDRPLKEREIADRFNISRSWVSMIIGKNLNKLRTHLENLGMIEITDMKKKKSSTSKTIKESFKSDYYSSEKDVCIALEKKQDIIENDIVKEFLQIFKNIGFEQMDIIDIMIISLTLKYNFTPESIALFLDIEPDEVRKMTKKAFLIYKDNMNELIENAYDVLDECSTSLSKQKNR